MTTKTNEYDDLTQIETNYCKSDWYNDNVNVNDDDLCIQFYLHCLHVLCNLRIHCNRIEVKLAYVEQQTTLSQHRPTYTKKPFWRDNRRPHKAIKKVFSTETVKCKKKPTPTYKFHMQFLKWEKQISRVMRLFCLWQRLNISLMN